MDQFKAFLLKNHSVTLKVASHYIKWILGCYHFNNQEIGRPVEEGAIRHYLKHLASDHEDWQVEQARNAINLYCYFLDKAGKSVVSPSASANREWQQAIDQMVKAMRLKHLSYRTEQTYLAWMRSFYSFLNGTSPWQLESRDVMSFLTHLAVERKVAKSTQNLAFNAILFFSVGCWIKISESCGRRCVQSASSGCRWC